MDWEMKGQECDSDNFRDFDIKEVLIEYDGPRLFVAQTAMCTALFMLVDEAERAMRFIVVPTSERIISELKSGIISVRGALDQPLMWIVETNMEYQPEFASCTSLEELPQGILPEQGLMLWPHLQPAFTLRAIGEDLSAGSVPASVIRQVIEGASTALRKAASYVLNEPNRQGRARNSLKRLYDLPAQRFAYNSFEIAFRLPEEEQEALWPDDDTSEMQKIGAALQQAISKSLSSASDDNILEALDIELLEALEKLVPPSSGIVTEFQVGGTLVNREGKSYTLDRNVSKNVRKALQAVRGKVEKITTIEGTVSEMDKDNLSFTLRQTSDGKDHICTFSADLYDEVIDAFVNGHRATVSGRETLKNGNIEVSIFNTAVQDSDDEGKR